MSESAPGERLRGLFDEYWPSYQRWMRRSPEVALDTCLRQLRRQMPEFVPTFDALRETLDADDEAARFLTLYRPPRLVRGCSQLVVDDDGPVLIRTYDHSPLLFDGVILRSRWNETTTIALTDCICGALDGVNDRGLAVALAFGGRNVVGDGFGAQLVTRYILETCATTTDACDALQRIEVHMPYTFVIADESGDFVTVFTGPDRPVRFVKRRASTNLQSLGDWPAYQLQTQSLERLREIEGLLDRKRSIDEIISACLRPPIWQTDYRKASGTLYLAAYRPGARKVMLHWPTHSTSFSIDRFKDREFTIDLDAQTPAP